MPSEALLDANVLLRHLTGDPPPLAKRAADLLQTAQQRRMNAVVAPLTVAEVVFVLESVYGWQREAIANGLLDLFSASVLLILEEDVLRRALTWYRDLPGVHFADAYVAALAVQRGHATIMSFDRAMRRVPGITVIDDAKQLPSA